MAENALRSTSIVNGARAEEQIFPSREWEGLDSTIREGFTARDGREEREEIMDRVAIAPIFCGYLFSVRRSGVSRDT